MCWIFTGKNSRFRHKIPNSVFLKYFHKLEFLDKKWTIGPLWQVEKMGESPKSHKLLISSNDKWIFAQKSGQYGGQNETFSAN